MKLPGFLEEIKEEANRWKLVWGVRSGYLMTAWFTLLAVLSDIIGILPTPWLYALIPLKLLTNTFMWAGIKTRRLLVLSTAINSITDVFVFTVIIYFTGGPFSTLIPIFFIEIAIMALLSNLGITILFSILTIGFYGTMTLLIVMRVIPQQPAFIEPLIKKGELSLGFISVNLAVLTFVLGVMTFSAASILRLLRERERDLEEKTRKLEEAGRMKNEFLRNITHEFRTPVHGVLGLAALLEDGVYGPITEKQKEALGGINASAQTLLQLIDDFIDLARFEAKKIEVRAMSVRIDEVIASVVSTAQWIQGKRRLAVTTEVQPDLPELMTDRGKLVHILLNILSNAVKFTPDGGKIVVQARRNNAQSIEISVKDTGIGIPPKDLPYIFDEFRQVDGSMSREYGGAGLGLSLVKNLTELLEGHVSVESTPGQGSIFTVRLPLKSP